MDYRIIDQANPRKPTYCYAAKHPCPLDPTRICGLETNTRETVMWCPECSAEHEYTQMTRVYVRVRAQSVWHEHHNPTTGQVESDPKKFAAHLREASDKVSERLGILHDFQPCDPHDTSVTGATEEGLDATHDAQVAAGTKQSRGKFVW